MDPGDYLFMLIMLTMAYCSDVDDDCCVSRYLVIRQHCSIKNFFATSASLSFSTEFKHSHFLVSDLTCFLVIRGSAVGIVCSMNVSVPALLSQPLQRSCRNVLAVSSIVEGKPARLHDLFYTRYYTGEILTVSLIPYACAKVRALCCSWGTENVETWS